jgi:hypothetical protein
MDTRWSRGGEILRAAPSRIGLGSQSSHLDAHMSACCRNLGANGVEVKIARGREMVLINRGLRVGGANYWASGTSTGSNRLCVVLCLKNLCRCLSVTLDEKIEVSAYIVYLADTLI